MSVRSREETRAEEKEREAERQLRVAEPLSKVRGNSRWLWIG